MGKTTTAEMFAALGCLVFDADAAVHKLYSKGGRAVPLIRAVFPWVGEMRAEFLAKAKAEKAKAVVFDIPLLFETGGETHVAAVVVTAPAHIQRSRVMSRPGMTKDLFEMILSKQMPDTEKRSRADYIVQTDKGLEAAREQVAVILDKILHT